VKLFFVLQHALRGHMGQWDEAPCILTENHAFH